MKELQVGIFGFTEPNIHWRHPGAMDSLTQTTRKVLKYYRMQVTESDEPTNGPYKPGGTTTTIVQPWCGRVADRGEDALGLGRWSWIKIKGTQNKATYCITAYRPVTGGTEMNNNTIRAQQRRILRRRNIDTDPRDKCINDLIQQINQWQTDNSDIILMIDANEQVDDRNSGLARLIHSCQLIDLTTSKHSETPPNTYHRSERRLDYILGSPRVQQAIIRSGYLPFHEIIRSDHRAAYIDLDGTILLGSKPPIYDEPSKRTLKSTNLRIVAKYTRILDNYCNKHQLKERSAALHSITEWNSEEKQEIENIDQLFTSGMLLAEKKCGHNFNAPWSPTLHHCYLRMKYWRIAMAGIKTNTIVDAQLGRITDGLPKNDELLDKTPPYTLKTTNTEIRKARKALTLARSNATETRQLFLATAIDMEAMMESSSNKLGILQRIHKKESRQNVFQRLRKARSAGQSNGLSKVLIPTEGIIPTAFHPGESLTTSPWPKPAKDQEWKTIDTREELETALLIQNEQHFSQAQGSPFTTEPLSTLLSYNGLTKFGDEILEGKANLSALNVTRETKLLIQAMQRRAPPLPIDRISEQDVAQGYKKWREATTTSPSGRHLGHYKALLRTNKELQVAETFHAHQQLENKDTPKDPITPRTPSDIPNGHNLLKIHVNLLNASLASGYSLSRWHTRHNLFLEKDPGQPKINRLRVIHIYPADWNLLLKFFGPLKTMRWAEHHNTLDEAQGGGRPGRSAIDLAVKKELTFSIMRLLRLNGGCFDNDATACFDRIIENQSNLSCKAQGSPDSFLRLHANTMQHTKYYMRTNYGVSKGYNMHGTNTPFWGSGQGAGDSTTRWVFTSTPLLAAQRKHGHKSAITSPDGRALADTSVDAFIDDSYQILVAPNHTDEHTINKQMQDNAQLWERLLYATGGKLNLSKCSFHRIQWSFQPDGTPILDDLNPNESISITESDSDNPIQVTQLRTSKAYKSLGVKIAPDGNSNEAIQQMKTKIKELIQAILTSRLNAQESWVAYDCVFLTAISYTLPATLITHAQLDQIQKPAVTTFLNLMGFNRHMPRPVVFGPIKFGGLGLAHLGIEQGVQKILFIIRHIRSKTTMGNMITALVHNYQLTAGTSQPILQRTEPLPHCEGTWLDLARDFLHFINGTIELEYDYTTKKLRENDAHLMDIVLASNYSNSEKAAFNRCRIFLQVTLLSEITDQTGKSLLTDILNTTALCSGHSPLARISLSTLQWPQQACPNKTTWGIWCRIIKTTILTTQQKLRHPLGRWHRNWTLHPRRWTHMINIHSKTLLIRLNTTQSCPLHEHKQINTTRREWHFETRGTLSDQSPTADGTVPAPSLRRTHNTIASPIPANTLDETPTTHPHTITETITTTHPWEAALTHTIQQTSPTAVNSLQDWPHGNALQALKFEITCSGEKHQPRQFSWLISLQDQTLFTCTNTAPGTNDQMNHYRATGYGLLSALRCWTHLNNQYQISRNAPSTLHGTISCTNLKLTKILTRILPQHRLHPAQCNKPDSDITTSIWTTIKDLEENGFSVQVIPIPVQDSTTPTPTPPPHTLPNSTNNPTELLYGAGCLLRVNRNPITSNTTPSLREAASTQDLREYLGNKFTWSSADIDDIDWTAFGSAMSKTPTATRPFVQKLINGWLPLLSFLKIQDNDEDDTCPSCKGDPETIRHFLQCTSTKRVNQWLRLRTELDTFFTETHTDAGLRAMLRQAIAHLSTDSPMQLNARLHERYHSIWHSQARLGWIQVLYGRYSYSWATRQDLHLHELLSDSTINPTRIQQLSGDKWLAGLIKIVWTSMHRAWKERNTDLHGPNPLADSQHARIRLRHKIQALFEMRTKIGAIDRDIYPELEILLLGSNRTMQAWITYAEPFISDAAQREATRIKQGTQDIRNFFRPNTSAPPRRDNSTERPP